MITSMRDPSTLWFQCVLDYRRLSNLATEHLQIDPDWFSPLLNSVGQVMISGPDDIRQDHSMVTLFQSRES